MTLVWVVRGLLLFALFPIVVPIRAFVRTYRSSPLSIWLLTLAASLNALAIVLAIVAGVVGELMDVLIVFGLFLLLWKWPRGVRAQLHEKLRLAYRGAQNAACEELRCSSTIEMAFCMTIIAFAIVLSLSSGLLYFLTTVAVVLFAIGLVWKWPHSEHLPFLHKLKFAARALGRELRNRLR